MEQEERGQDEKSAAEPEQQCVRCGRERFRRISGRISSDLHTTPRPNAHAAHEDGSDFQMVGRRKRRHQLHVALDAGMVSASPRNRQTVLRFQKAGNCEFFFRFPNGFHSDPALKAILRFKVRMAAITYLQRALLVHDLQTLTAEEWESCFNLVLFPLLGKLLEPKLLDEVNLEETRVRAATVLSKVFLHHLTPLLSLPSFTSLWLNILDFMDKYMHVERSDLLVG